jgi:TonB family protein
VLATGSVEDAEAWAKAERSLKRAVELNPTFGPGYGQLAYEYLRREQNLEEALGIARRAVELEPNNMTYLVNAAEISLRLNRPDEARVVAERIAAVAATEDERTMATAYLEGLQHYARPTKLSNTIHYDAKGADLEPWIHKMVTEVQSVWRIPPSDTFEAGHVAVEAFMSRSGEILSLRIKASSGDREFDSAAEQALRQAVLSALPEDYPENVFEFVLVFWYNQKPTT